MDKAIVITLGLFMWGLFGNIFNFFLYYLIYMYKLIFDFLYYVGTILDMGNVGRVLILITFYVVIIKGLFYIVKLFLSSF